MDAMGVKIPRGRANDIAKWLKDNGSDNGWKQVDAKDAQAAANRGEPAIVSWFNNSYKKDGLIDEQNPWSHYEYSGHIAVIRPEDTDQNLKLQDELKYKYPNLYKNRIGVYMAQAGMDNYNYTLVELGFGKAIRNQINPPNDYYRYYIHK